MVIKNLTSSFLLCIFVIKCLTIKIVITFGYILKQIREDKRFSLKFVSDSSGIDTSMLSKIEAGKRIASMQQILKLAKVYELDDSIISLIQRESDDIVNKFDLSDVDMPLESIRVAEDNIAYGSQYLSLFMEAIYSKPIALESRRYIGSKAKLIDWIMDTIKSETDDVHSFFDVFAGTGVVTKAALNSFDYVFTNDFLYSNNLIYKAFFGEGDFDEIKIGDFLDRYNEIDPNLIPENYFSVNFGGKYFEHEVAKLIGFIRQDIEDKKESLTEKEYCILIATLIYNIDSLVELNF